MGKAFFLGTLLSLHCVSSFASNANDEAVASLNEVLAQFKASGEGINCSAEKEPCTFNYYCSRLRKNRLSEVLYRNSEGEEVPNFVVQELKKSVNQCVLSKRATATTADLKGADKKTPDFTKVVRDLNNAILRNKDETAYFRIQNAMLDTSITPPNEVWSSAEKRIRFYETTARVKLHDETRRLWVTSLSPAYTGVDISGPSSGPSENPYEDKNPFSNYNILSSTSLSPGEVATLRARYQARLNKAFEVFQDTKKQVIGVLTRKRTNANAIEIDSMIKRIDGIKMGTSDVADSVSLCSSPNAFYRKQNHTFTLCPQVLPFPTAALQSTIAHELAHAIDPCIVANDLILVPGTDKIQKESTGNYFSLYTPELPEQPSETYSVIDWESRGSDRKDASLLNNRVISNAVPEVKHPYASVIKCLQQPYSAGARVGDTEFAKKVIAKKIQRLREAGADGANPELSGLLKTAGRIDGVYGPRSTCSFMSSDGGPSQMQEAFSDWMAAEVIAQKVSSAKTSEEKLKFAFEANSLFGAAGCASFESEAVAMANKKIKDSGCFGPVLIGQDDLENMREAKDVHPEDYNRINKIFLANETIQKALSCTPLPDTKHCE